MGRILVVGGTALMVAACVVGSTSSGERGDACSSHAGCDSDLLCIAEKCERPYSRRWRLTVESARVSAHELDGQNWDSTGTGLPDPYVVILVDNQELLRTTTRTDTTNAMWGESVAFTLTSSTLVQATLYDDDPFISQPVMTTGAQDVDADELRAGQAISYAATGPQRVDGGIDPDETSVMTLRWTLDE